MAAIYLYHSTSHKLAPSSYAWKPPEKSLYLFHGCHVLVAVPDHQHMVETKRPEKSQHLRGL